jgi:GNAT superfamily N-acetyltransferase
MVGLMSEVTIRRAVIPDDEPAIVELLRRTMGWAPGDQAEQLFRWKHRLNPAGPSPMWLAEAGGRIVGLRAFLRWTFERDGRLIRAVRAVDTVTDPDHRGMGLFTTLTLGALEELAAEGVDFVFNTPNTQSLGGYTKMGWQTIGTLPAFVRIRSMRDLPRVVRSRGPANLDSLPCSTGVSAAEGLADGAAVESLLMSTEPPAGVHTPRSLDFLRWRYVAAPLGYRLLAGTEGISGGVVLFRLRRRVLAIEATIGDVIVPGNDRRRAGALVRSVVRSARADFAIMMTNGARPSGCLRLNAGPLLTAREITTQPPTSLDGWALSLGDIELF